MQRCYFHLPTERTRQTLRERELILKAIESGDGKAAEEATPLHLEAARRTALSQLTGDRN